LKGARRWCTDGAKISLSASDAAHRGGNTTAQLLHFQPFAASRGLKPTVGHVPCKIILEMCV
jgi:hypothetical protein